MELSEFLKAGLKELQNRRKLVSHSETLQNQRQRRRSSRIQNLMTLRKIGEAILSPFSSPIQTKFPDISKVPLNSSPLKRTNSKSKDDEVKNKYVKEEGNKNKIQNTDKRRALLLKWKEEKNKKSQLEKNAKKPIFKVSQCAILPSIETANQFIKGKRITPKAKGNTPSLYKFAPKNHTFKPPANIKPIYFKNSSATINNIPVLKNALIDQSEIKMKVKSKRKLDFKSNYDEKENSALIKRQDKDKGTLCKPLIKSNQNITLLEENCGRQTRCDKSVNSKISNKYEKTSSIINATKKNMPKKASSCTNLSMKNNENTETEHVNNEREKLKKQESKKNLTLKTPTKSKNKENSVIVKKEKNNSSKKKKNGKCQPLTVNTTIPEPLGSSNDVLNENTSPVRTPVSSNPPMYISPFITLSRGKDSACKEYRKRLSKGGTFDHSDMSKYTSPKAAASYFRSLLNQEISEIQSICEYWNALKDINLPDGATDMINVAIGQSQLLINQKLEQFRDLIQSAEDKSGNVTCHDLHGFWDLVNIQIKNVRDRFDNLERLKGNDWDEIICVKVKTPIKKKNVSRKEGKRKVNSKIKNFIAEARQKKKLEANGQNIAEETETFLKTPNDKSTKKQRSSTYLLKRESSSSPGLTMIKASLSAKQFQQSLSTNCTPVNLAKTASASKSILKSTHSKHSKSRPKSVLFFDCNNEAEYIEGTETFTPENSTGIRRSSRLNEKLLKNKLFYQ